MSMNDATNDLPALVAGTALTKKVAGLELASVYASLAVSDNTKKAYRAAVRSYREAGGRLPATEIDVLSYLGGQAGRLKPDTLSLHLSALRAWHAQGGFADPTRTTAVAKTLAGIRRSHAQVKKKARPLLVDGLRLIVRRLTAVDTLRAKRDSALLQIGFFGAFRRQELVKIECGDIEWVSEGIKILLRRSKTDQSGEGLIRVIPFGDDDLCPVRALRAWLDASSIVEGPIFRAVSRAGAVAAKGLNAATVPDLLTAAASAVGLTGAEEMSGHSLRRGMATSARQYGADLIEIKRQGGWRDDRTVQGYIDDADQFKNTAAGRLLGQHGKRKDSV
jgi:integrase